MADQDDFMLDAEFAAFRQELSPQVTPPGPVAVRATVRRRRQVATGATVALALALVVGPVAGYAALGQEHGRPADPATSSSPDVTGSPSATPPASPDSPSSTPGAPATEAPDGRISRAELLRAAVDLPDWPSTAPDGCGSRDVRLADDDPAATRPTLTLLRHGDADGDGAAETVALLRCQLFQEVVAEQVVVFDRDTAGGIVTLGQVVANWADGIGWFADLSLNTAGTVRVQVADRSVCCGGPKEWSQKQWRSYRWGGDAFTQVGGPRSFGPNPRFADLQVVSASDVVFAERPDDWWRHGTITVTLRNNGPADIRKIELTFSFGPGLMRHEGDGWRACTKVSDTTSVAASTLTCELGPLAAGKQRTLTLGLSNSLSQPDRGTGSVHAVYLNRIDGADHALPDGDGNNNSRGFDFR